MSSKGNSNHFVSTSLQERIVRTGVVLTAILVSIFIVTPLTLMLLIAFQSQTSIFAGAEVSIITLDFSLNNFVSLYESTNIVTYFKNSLIITSGSVILSTTLATTTGYGLTRFNFRGKTYLARITLFTYMFSPIILALPLYIIFNIFGLLNTYFAVILAVTGISVPFNVWLMWQYFQTIPIKVEESAWTRGASKPRALWDIVLPMARPGYISAAIFSFGIAWNDYTMSRVLLSEDQIYPLSVGANLFLEEISIGWGETMATAFIICVPPFIIALTLQKYLLKGFSVSGLQ